MWVLSDQTIKGYRRELIKHIKGQVRPYLKDSPYRNGDKPIKACELRTKVKLQFLQESIIGFTSKEVVVKAPFLPGTLSCVHYSNICLEDLQVLSQLNILEVIKLD